MQQIVSLVYQEMAEHATKTTGQWCAVHWRCGRGSIGEILINSFEATNVNHENPLVWTGNMLSEFIFFNATSWRRIKCFKMWPGTSRVCILWVMACRRSERILCN
jgi:hypothetical protein